MSKSVLIAEDETFLRRMLQMELEEHGLLVRTAANGEEALDELKRSLPDILLLDLLMPKMDGYTVLKSLQDQGHRFPVIVMSNLSDASHMQRCLELGACDFIVKSNIDSADVWKKIEPYVG